MGQTNNDIDLWAVTKVECIQSPDREGVFLLDQTGVKVVVLGQLDRWLIGAEVRHLGQSDGR